MMPCSGLTTLKPYAKKTATPGVSVAWRHPEAGARPGSGGSHQSRRVNLSRCSARPHKGKARQGKPLPPNRDQGLASNRAVRYKSSFSLLGPAAVAAAAAPRPPPVLNLCTWERTERRSV